MNHWALLLSKMGPGWEPPPAPKPPKRAAPLCTHVYFEGHLPPPTRKCEWCGKVSDAKVWEREEFKRRFHGSFNGKFPKPGAPTSLIGVHWYYPCFCLQRKPYTHWIVAVAKKETAGWG